ncbi:hypothetical protein ACF0H5_008877 [Mactra antiquata]
MNFLLISRDDTFTESWNNSKTVMTSQSYPTSNDLSQEMTKTVLPVTILIAVECVLGVFGNIFILIVYSKWYKLCSFRCFVLSLACIDLTSSVTTLPGEIVSQLNWYHYKYDAMCKIKSFFNVFTVWSSGLVLLLLAYDRYRKICYPLSWQIPVRNSARLCVAAILFSIVISSPIAVLWGIQSYEYNFGNYTVQVSICEKAEMFADEVIPFMYILWALVIPMFMIMLVTIILNFYTGRKLMPSLRNNTSQTDVRTNGVVPRVNAAEESVNGSSGTYNGDGNHYSDHNSVPRHRHRRFSFPYGSWSLRRKILIDKIHHFRLSGYHLHDIPEVGNSLTPRSITVHTYPKENPRKRHRHHFSTSDISETDSTPTTSWRGRYIVRKLTTRRRKTLIMLVLTGVFIFTVLLYLTLVCVVAKTGGALRQLSNSQKVIFFFFWRLYFINSVINPILYGFMDHRFRQGLVRLFCGKKRYFKTRRNMRS